MRNNKKVSEAENKYFEILWYVRHNLGKERWLEEYQNSKEQKLRDIAKKALENAKRIEIEYAEDPEFIAIKDALSEDYFEKFNKTLHYVKYKPLTLSFGEKEPPTTLTMNIEELFEDHNSIYNQGWDDGYYRGIIDGKLSALRWVLGAEWDFLDT